MISNDISDIEKHGGSGMRAMVNDANDIPYEYTKSLKKAKKMASAYVVMEGDWGGQIYLTCPARLINCKEKKLREILKMLDDYSWRCNRGDGRSLYYEVIEPGHGVAGGMGGGEATDGLWLHEELEGFREQVAGALFCA